MSILYFDGGKSAAFNEENIYFTDHDIEALARVLIPTIQKFFQDENNVHEFEVWKNNRP